MKKIIVIFFILLTACSQEDAFNCLSDFAYDLGTLSAQEITGYEQSGCCLYNGGVSPYVSCSGLIVCKDQSISSCQKQ